eukprot:g25548.t1
MDRVNSKGLFLRMVEFKTRRHIFNVKGENFKNDMRGNIFTQTVAHVWNELPEEVVDVGAVTTFRRYSVLRTILVPLLEKDFRFFGGSSEEVHYIDSRDKEFVFISLGLYSLEFRRMRGDLIE